jgi:hypothetical protein
MNAPSPAACALLLLRIICLGGRLSLHIYLL